jgi:hypothetical protein
MLVLVGCAPGEVSAVGDPPDATVARDDGPAADGGAADVAADATAATPDRGAPADDLPSPDVAAPRGRLGEVTRDGDGVRLRTHPTVNYRFVDAAWDLAGRTCLVVYGNGPVGGAFLDEGGAQVGDGFRLTDLPHPGGPWSQLPRVAAGRASFVVTWHVEVERSAAVQARRVLAGGVFGGPAVTVSEPGSQQESPAAIAYAPEVDEFLVVWAQQGLKGRRLDGEGAPRGGVVALSPPGAWVEQPAVAWHAGARTFFVTYMTEMGGTRVNLQRVAAGTGAPVGAALSLSGDVEFAKVTDAAYDARAGEVVATWFAVRGGARSFEAQRVRGDGEPAGARATVFAPHQSYDGYDLAWSPVTGTSFATFHGAGAEAAGAELDADNRSGAPFEVTAAMPRNGVFLPRVVAHPSRPWWIVLGSPDYSHVVAQRVAWRPR